MGKTTTVLANHNLNTSSVKALASDLSKRLKCTIEYGCAINFDFEDQNNNTPPSLDPVVLNVIKYEASTKTRRLLEIKEDANALFYDFTSVEDNNNLLATINKHSVEVWALHSWDWSSFCRLFSFKSGDAQIKNLNAWRKTHQDFIKTFGGTELLIGCFETESNLIFEAAYKQKSWDALKQLASREIKNGCLDVSEFILKNKSEALKPYLQPFFNGKTTSYYSTEKNSNYWEDHKKQNNATYFDIYFDDFRDL